MEFQIEYSSRSHKFSEVYKVTKEIYEIALKNAFTEIGNICPDIQASLLFDKEATIVAKDEKTPEKNINNVADSLGTILEKSGSIGGLNSLLIEGSNGSVHLSSINDLYLTMVLSKKADMKYVETVARVLIPTVMKLLDNLDSNPLRQLSSKPTFDKPDEKEKEVESPEEEIEQELEPIEEKPSLPDFDLPSNQLIVDSFGGLLVRSDTVQVSEDIVSQWEEQLDGKKISRVVIEAFNGQSTESKVKALDESKLGNKATIRIPEKLCESLDVKRGELVRVKPVVN
jgi:predicted regulator of Ras-like GTPase activity (Roadblock/LC7/MglB family)